MRQHLSLIWLNHYVIALHHFSTSSDYNLTPACNNHSESIREVMRINPLSPGIKLQILLLCFHTFQAVKIPIELNMSDHVLNSHDVTN